MHQEQREFPTLGVFLQIRAILQTVEPEASGDFSMPQWVLRVGPNLVFHTRDVVRFKACLLYTSDAADE